MSEENLLKIKELYEKYTNKKFSMSEHDNRLTLQKIICAVECSGSQNFEYSFGWYLRGPYSPALASDGYHIDANINDITAKIELNKEKIDNTLKKDLDFLSNLRQFMGDEKNLELYSSILFLKVMEKRVDEEIFNTIKITKPWYEEGTIRKSIEDIMQLLKKDK